MRDLDDPPVAFQARDEHAPVHERCEQRVYALDVGAVPVDRPARVVAVVAQPRHLEQRAPEVVLFLLTRSGGEHGVGLAGDGALQAAELLVGGDLEPLVLARDRDT